MPIDKVRLGSGAGPALLTDALLPTPEPSKVLGWDGNQFTSVLPKTPVYADAAARDAGNPAPSDNDLAIVPSLGFQQRWGLPASGARRWLNTVHSREGGPVSVAHVVGDGVADDVPFMSAADIAVTAGKGRVEIDPVTAQVMVKSNFQINNHFRPAKGCNIYVAAGVTFIINAEFDPGLYRVFDPTSPGTIIFTKVRRFSADWFGIVGDAVTNDAPALNFMTRSIPDNSTVFFNTLWTIVVRNEWLTSGRRGIRYVSEVHPFPDGFGATILWDGPPPQLGRGVNNATITNASPFVTFSQPLTRVPQPGERFIYRGPGTPNLNALVIADAGNSTTQVKLDTAAVVGGGPFVGGQWTLGGSMVSLISCDHCEISGFAILPHPTTGNQVGQGFAGYIAAGSTTLHNASGDPASGLNKVGHIIRILGVGPGGTDFITTIDAAAGDGSSCTLHAAPPNGIANTVLTQYIIGPNATSLPATYGVILDLGGINGATGTNCYVTKNLFNCQVNDGFLSVGVSLTYQNNQELHEIIRNTFHVADFGGLFHDFSGRCTTVAGSTTIATDAANLIPVTAIGNRIRIPGVGAANFTVATAFLSGNTLTASIPLFAPNMVGLPVVVHGAGPAGADLVTTVQSFNGPASLSLAASSSIGATNVSGYVGGAILDTYVTGYLDNQHFTVATAPVVSAASKVPTIGNFANNCIEIGASFNAKRIVIEHNIFSNFQYAVWCRNGSFQARGNQAEVGEMFYCIDGNSTPCTSFHDDHEAVLRMMGVSNILTGGGYPVTFYNTRLGTLNMICHGGHFMSGQGTGPVRVIGAGFDTQSNGPESTYFEHHGGQWAVEDCLFPNGPAATMANVIDLAYLLSVNGQFYGRNLKSVTDVPAYEFYYGAEFGTRQFIKGRVQSLGGHLLDLSLQNADDSTNPISTIRANIECGGGGPSQEIAALDLGIGQSDVDSGGNGMDVATLTGALIRLPIATNWRSTQPGKAIHAIHIKPPANVNTVTNPIYGVRIEGIQVSGINTTPRAIWQEGTGDENLVAGLTTFGSGRVEKATVYIDIGAGGSATPNAAGAELYRYRIAGAATVNKPINLRKGMRLKVVIFNNTAGAITPTLDASFLGTGFGAIGAGKSRSRTYTYDDVLDKLEPIGAVSEDF